VAWDAAKASDIPARPGMTGPSAKTVSKLNMTRAAARLGLTCSPEKPRFSFSFFQVLVLTAPIFRLSTQLE
jgi:hypothetical protein